MGLVSFPYAWLFPSTISPRKEEAAKLGPAGGDALQLKPTELDFPNKAPCVESRENLNGQQELHKLPGELPPASCTLPELLSAASEQGSGGESMCPSAMRWISTKTQTPQLTLSGCFGVLYSVCLKVAAPVSTSPLVRWRPGPRIRPVRPTLSDRALGGTGRSRQVLVWPGLRWRSTSDQERNAGR